MNTQNIKEKLLKEKAAKEKTIAQCQKRIKEIDAKDGMAEITTTYIHLNDTDIMKAIPFIDNIYHPAALSEKIDQ